MLFEIPLNKLGGLFNRHDFAGIIKILLDGIKHQPISFVEVNELKLFRVSGNIFIYLALKGFNGRLVFLMGGLLGGFLLGKLAFLLLAPKRL